MNKINIKMFDSSFTRHVMDSLAKIGIHQVDQAANDNTHSADHSERKLKDAEKALRKLSDAELHDLGISRGEISHVVRHGRHGIDPTSDHARIDAA